MPRLIPVIPGFRLGLTLILLLFWLPAASQRSLSAWQQESPIHRQFGFSRSKKKAATKNRVQQPKKTGTGASKSGQKSTGRVRPNEDFAPLALGYSILSAKDNGESEQILLTKNTEAFRLGDRIRLLIEANDDGYLYVFNTIDGKDPEMIFPSPRLNGGDNLIEAHVPQEIPSRENKNPKLRWFEFQPPAGTEELYIVFSRSKLKTVPSGLELMNLCKRKNCNQIRPDSKAWAFIIGVEKEPKIKETADIETQNLDDDITKSVSRRIRLAPDAAKPTTIYQTRSNESGEIVVTVKITSK